MNKMEIDTTDEERKINGKEVKSGETICVRLPVCYSKDCPGEKKIVFPVWTNSKKYYYSVDDIVGATACWAIRQAPYLIPNKLELALHALAKELRRALKFGDEPMPWVKLSCNELRDVLALIFKEKAADIVAWNEPVKGKERNFAWIDRYSKLKPEYDFIDLDALARNVAHMLTLEREYEE